MDKEYIAPEIEVVTFEITEAIMETGLSSEIHESQPF